MSKDNDYSDIDNQIEDIDEIEGTDIKINPDYYIHNALKKAQECITNPNLKTGLMQFRILIEQIEILCSAGNMLPDNYEITIENYKKEISFDESNEMSSLKLAHKKELLLLKSVFSSKPLSSKLTLKSVKK